MFFYAASTFFSPEFGQGIPAKLNFAPGSGARANKNPFFANSPGQIHFQYLPRETEECSNPLEANNSVTTKTMNVGGEGQKGSLKGGSGSRECSRGWFGVRSGFSDELIHLSLALSVMPTTSPERPHFSILSSLSLTAVYIFNSYHTYLHFDDFPFFHVSCCCWGASFRPGISPFRNDCDPPFSHDRIACFRHLLSAELEAMRFANGRILAVCTFAERKKDSKGDVKTFSTAKLTRLKCILLSTS